MKITPVDEALRFIVPVPLWNIEPRYVCKPADGVLVRVTKDGVLYCVTGVWLVVSAKVVVLSLIAIVKTEPAAWLESIPAPKKVVLTFLLPGVMKGQDIPVTSTIEPVVAVLKVELICL